jgi:hypothetical protein
MLEFLLLVTVRFACRNNTAVKAYITDWHVEIGSTESNDCR